MYLILIGWLYVVLMLAVAQDSLVRTGTIVFFLGVLPTWLTLLEACASGRTPFDVLCVEGAMLRGPNGTGKFHLMAGSGRPLTEWVARLAAQEWNTTGQIGLVVGATFPAEIARVRALIGDMPLLVPGIGAQGGDIEATVKAGRTGNGTGLMINSSRAILYAGKDEHFAEPRLS